MNRSSTGCWPRPSTASAGGGIGLMSSGSARARGTRPTCRGRRPGPIAIMSSARSTATRRFRSSSLEPTGRRCRDRPTPIGSTRRRPGSWSGGRTTSSATRRLEGMLQQRADDLDDMITATGTTFLGLTIQCARCHDHKFDPIAQKDYYGFQAIFAGVNHAERELAAPDSMTAAHESGRDHGRAGPDRTTARRQRAAGPARSRYDRCGRWSTRGATSSDSRR